MPFILECLMEGHNWVLNQFVEKGFLKDQLLSASYLFLQKPVYTSHHFRSAVHDHRLRSIFLDDEIFGFGVCIVN